MNYFGHATVASWTSAAPGTLLGAMLPDFQTMSGARVLRTPDADVATGIDNHHATDSKFHRLPVVTGLMRELDDILERLGCARGPRRAVAHIGVELLLDGVLVAETAYRAAYLAGLAHEAVIEWRDPGDGERFARLIARLREYGVPEDLKRPASITQRLARVLGHRPLLAPSPDDLRAIGTALVEYQPRVVVAAETVMRAMRA